MSIITLIDKYLEDLMEERNNFIDDLNQFPNFEKQVRRLSNELASGILSLTLSEADELIRNSGLRKDGYSIQRKDDRSLISSVGDFHFQHTLFKDKATGRYHYLLDELISLPDKERLTSEAEAIMLNEAEVHLYQHAAEAISVGSQKVSKTTVMNKVHSCFVPVRCSRGNRSYSSPAAFLSSYLDLPKQANLSKTCFDCIFRHILFLLLIPSSLRIDLVKI